jgi:hypothetical protein
MTLGQPLRGELAAEAIRLAAEAIPLAAEAIRILV